MKQRRILVIKECVSEADCNDLICRLAWYFFPYLDLIDDITICAPAACREQVTVVDGFDAAISDLIGPVLNKIHTVSRAKMFSLAGRSDPDRELVLLADGSLEGKIESVINRHRPHGTFYRVDAVGDRMEGSFFLWAGCNSFVDQAARTAVYQTRFKRMHDELGFQKKAYVFGTGPSLSDYVDGHAFDDGLAIIANSIVKNPELLEKIGPRVIVAADPIFHAGCSSYAAAFRTSLIKAMEMTDSWFVCPFRDAAVYETYLPQHLHDRVIGIGFDNTASPPSDLTDTFALKPYPNVLTLLLLPLASTFADTIHIAGCDGRRIAEDSAFWAHDAKAQFVDEMEKIKRVHPGFFAIDYNDYYFEHAIDLEVVMSSLEDAGRTCISVTPSFVPALECRQGFATRDWLEEPSRGFDPSVIAILDPDAKNEWGHFLAYDRCLSEAAQASGLEVSLLAHHELPENIGPENATINRCLSVHSWSVGNRGPNMSPEIASALADELAGALQNLERQYLDKDILLFMYCGSLQIVELLEYLLIERPRIRAVVNLFWAYGFDFSDQSYQKRYLPILRRAAKRDSRVRLMHSTLRITNEYTRIAGLQIPVLLHPSTSFSDKKIKDVQHEVRALHNTRRPHVLFPGGARVEKGFLLSVSACQILEQRRHFKLTLRARLDVNCEEGIRRACAELTPTPVELVDQDFGDQEFVNWLDSADVLVIPYLPEAFRWRTSGLLIDAVLLGIPVVVIKGTWLADEVEQSQAGVLVEPHAHSIADGVTEVLDNYAKFSAAARAFSRRYAQRHSWRALVSQLISSVNNGRRDVVELTRLRGQLQRVDSRVFDGLEENLEQTRKKLSASVTEVEGLSADLRISEKELEEARVQLGELQRDLPALDVAAKKSTAELADLQNKHEALKFAMQEQSDAHKREKELLEERLAQLEQVAETSNSVTQELSQSRAELSAFSGQVHLLEQLWSMSGSTESDASGKRSLSLVGSPLKIDQPVTILDKALLAWQKGAWIDLVRVRHQNLEEYPDRDKLALLIAAGLMQLDQFDEALWYLNKARDWGCTDNEVATYLLSGAYNSLAKASAALGKEQQADELFVQSVTTVYSDGAGQALGRARGIHERTQLGMLDQAAESMRQTLFSVFSGSTEDRDQVRIMKSQVDMLNSRIAESQLRRVRTLVGGGGEISGLQESATSQLGQDLWVLEQTQYKRKGFFVEFGATDGVLLNNTLLLETAFDWEGICAEPNPQLFRKLVANRNCITAMDCVARESGMEVEFILADEYGGVIDTAFNDMHKDLRRAYYASGEKLRMITISLHDFLIKHNAPEHIDYLSIDTEGSEYEILSAFPFEQWNIQLLTIEHNYGEDRARVRELLANNGYQCKEVSFDDWFFKSAQS